MIQTKGSLLTSPSAIFTVLFPIFASYKALRTSDPAQLTPWLMYWVVLSSALLIESWTVFILGWYAVPLFLTLIETMSGLLTEHLRC